MKKLRVLLIVSLVIVMSSCIPKGNEEVEIDCYQQPTHLSCIEQNEYDQLNYTDYYQENTSTDSNEEIKDVLNNLINIMNANEDFSNIFFLNEIEGYGHILTPNGISELRKDEIISFDYHDVIFKEAGRKAEYILSVLNQLILFDSIQEETEINIAQMNIYLLVEDNYFMGFIDDPVNKIKGIYVVEINEDNKLEFEVIEKSNHTPFTGNIIRYMRYVEDVEFHERRVQIDSEGHYYFEYHYQNDIDFAYTNVVTNIPEQYTLNVARSERYFSDNYYLVVSKSQDVYYKYFTLFKNNEIGLSVEKLQSDNVTVHNQLPGDKIYWNLLYTDGWDMIKNNDVYYNDTMIYTIDHISPSSFPYFGPSVLISNELTGTYSPSDLEIPVEGLTFDITELVDVSIPDNRLDEIGDILYVDDAQYSIYQNMYYFEDGLLFLIEDIIGLDKYTIFNKYLNEINN